MKLEKIKPGDILWTPPRRVRMGNTTMSRNVSYKLHVVEVDRRRKQVKAHWNVKSNPAKWYASREWSKWRYSPPKGAEI